MSRPHAIIVGAGPGMGLALARRFATEGHGVSLIARRSGPLDRFVASVKTRRGFAAAYVADAGDVGALADAIGQAEAEHGPCEVLVYNPAARIPASIADVEPEALVDTFRVNVAGGLAAVRAVLPGMRERGHGTILFTGGGLALRPLPNFGALAVGKAGQRSLVQSLAAELRGSGVYVGTVLIDGYVQAGTAFDPDRIADVFWRLHVHRPEKSEVLYHG